MASIYTMVGYGSQGESVRRLQSELNKQGYQLDEDGVFGEKTRAAVRDYQKKNSLKRDGIAGDETWGSLMSASASAAEEPQASVPKAAPTARTAKALAELEAERCPSLDRPADAFAVLLAGAAQGIADPVKRRVAEQLLYHLGRWVYLVDAADDLKEDLKTGSYNPLVLRYRLQDGALSEVDRQQLAGTLDGSVRAMAAAFELADFGVYAPVLRAAVYEGLYIVGAAVLNGTFHRRRRERQAIRKADTNDA